MLARKIKYDYFNMLMNNDRLNKKQMLLRKNHGKIISKDLLQHLNDIGLTDYKLVDLNESDIYIAQTKDGTLLIEGVEKPREQFVTEIKKLDIWNLKNCNIWITQSEYCGLINIDRVPTIETLMSLLDNSYFGGYASLYFDKVRLDIDIDESIYSRGEWLYSYKYIQL